MKNRFLKLLTLTLITGAMLVGCGGNETETNNGSGTNINTEANVNTDENADSNENLAQIDPNLEYTETQIAYLFVNEADIDTSMADGTEVPNTTAENVQQIVKVKESVDLYNKGKEKIGYLKDGVTIAFVNIDNEWCIIGSTDYSEIYYALATDMTPVIEVVEESNDTTNKNEENTDEMSDGAKAFFDKIKAGVIDDNKTIEEYGKEHPDMVMRYLEEANSPEGMDAITVLYSKPDSEEDYATAMDVIRQVVYNQGYSKYYLEYIGESDGVIEFKIYGGK